MKKTIVSLAMSSSLLLSGGFTLKSSEISGQIGMEQVYNGFGCTGENISPSFTWENAPEGTKSFAITLFDKDAPTGSGWWHWIVFDIPKKVSSLVKNSGNIDLDIMPKEAIQSITSFGTYGYGGACPPVGHGPHQYLFTIHALDVDSLGIDKNASPALAGFMMHSHTLAKAAVVGYYSR